MRPETISASQISTFLGCPRRYRYRYLDRQPPERRSVDLALGSAVHSAIAWWTEERIAGRTPELADILKIFRADLTAELVDELVDLAGLPPQHYYALGEGLIQIFVQRFQTDPPPLAAEHRFSVPLVDTTTGELLEVSLVGFIDFLTEGGIGELKTCARKTLPSQWELQLSAYAYAYQATVGRLPKVVVVELIKTKEPKIAVLETTVTFEDTAWFLEVAGEVLAAIEADTFFPNPGWQCPTCEFRRACRGR